MAKREDYQLRPLQKSDLEMVLSWRNSERVRANLYTDHIISLEEHQAWFKKIKDEPTVDYLICEFQNHPIGLVNFTNIDKNNNKCYWGFYLGETATPLGSGGALSFISMEYIFEIVDFRKVCSEVLSFNNKSLKLHKRLSFQEEGCFKKHIYKNLEYQDVICLALFQEDWLQNKNDIAKIVFRNK
ncbi:UDP-4-amino-4,6-dideoxy-N-acetyl-beta-L-altrosamine N-acetyltransferase [Dolichospermum circinale]|uniref:UDP-4-amino-4, 6-dideoxy-N-acetyl-beta-L-altrosamine N-acetyltransferase n=1 Tax=Dolichospermum circinale TaxID=109265 RepID=UPI00232BB900|nr:UDP-4-amino-4,6-dideoxy-N-acetyl-beta-L-altrosamine N-acetyltransferase [Dolichospermum circinale]MDB9453402.1 UDP-4-amino-4,6-dideoxy-N-acetyl-beta-L-altrosamine N-acetyltransferase [Dolichospermum circinale CS-541/06]MDB9461910.1 UDP-4-amino-4,6-dideoxy-N-acetyl-beta-L-altrosamine N-acetyltransferase [Dolichospermum circinale CS-541/04]MDB9549879.1 UDP-4-amino-4,6-dideoxy-N-acetyl-beta-L-altrosamine N-acetyltransferase [Dolichospermum circinale CS-1031]